MSSVVRALACGAAFSLVAWLGATLGTPCARAQAQDAQPEDGAPQHSIIELRFTPTRSAQLAIWIEDEAGRFLATLGLTDAVATRGLGNRPGASQMNSGFRWPYGRREGVLPVWAHRRASAPDAKQFRRVIFQDRTYEGLASRTSNDFSRDDYFCLSFDNSRSKKDALDAVSCASVFSSDKGRFITEADVASGYHEPYEDPASGIGRELPLSLTSLYPPRRDLKSCAPDCYEHADVAGYDAHVHEVMPEIDAITMATPQGGEPKSVLFSAPLDWAPGKYRACIEVNVEGDYNDRWNATSFPTPETPRSEWDYWATDYGYPYRGQPSVVYCVPFDFGMDGVIEESTDTAEGSVATWDTAAPEYGELGGMESMTDDPVHAPGSGADRLELSEDGYRMKVIVKPALECERDSAPTSIEELRVEPASNRLHAHEWATLSFKAAGDDVGIFRYEVRVSTAAMPDEASFMRGDPAKDASIRAEELRVPTDAQPGERVKVSFGGLIAQTHYFVGVRAIDGCANTSKIQVAELTTDKRVFATVTPCFVATAAYGSPLAAEISGLRRLRDRQLATNALGRAFIDLYWQVGPKLATFLREHEQLRSLARTALSPIVAFARELAD